MPLAKFSGKRLSFSKGGINISKDSFWTLIAQAKKHTGSPSEWLMKQLMDLGAEQAKEFDDIASAYTSLADQYSLWAAASVMERGCTDDGFINYRIWLVAQGKDVYMAAPKDPDSLVDVPDYPNCLFDSLPRMEDSTYE